VLNDNDNIILVTNINDVNNININSDKLFFTNQTTMSYFDTLDIIDELKKKYSNIDVNIDICTASKQRQVAVYDKCKECDIVLVIGDKKSNNTNKLKEICESLNIKSYLIETIEDLNKVDLYDNIKIGITAGSSTPNKLVNEIIKSLEDDEYISILNNKDLITF
jgi:4-hydroxy-3-methylbut-2-enyl diphosphate reductase